MSCIYIIYNLENGKCYVGSTKDFEKRKLSHLNLLKNGKHHSIILQRSYNKHSEQNFIFCILEFVNNLDQLFPKEIKWIERLKPEYNVGSVGGGDNTSKHPDLENIKKKMSIASKRNYQKLSLEKKQELIENRLGDKNGNWKGGISQSKCGTCKKIINGTAEYCRDCYAVVLKTKMLGKGNPFYGKTHSKETKEKLRQKHIGRVNLSSCKRIKINGIIYSSHAEAARALGVSNGLITYRVRKKYDGYEVL